MDWHGSTVFGIAILGAILGILNTWQAMRRDRLRLRVRPLNTVRMDAEGMGFAIEVTNLSMFAVTVEEVGFSLGSPAAKGTRGVVPNPQIIDGGGWPRRLESRSSVTLYFDRPPDPQFRRSIRRAYAKTACGEYAYGSTPALRQLRDES
jgi:hypothetical protein